MTRFDMQEMSPNTGLSGIEDLTTGRANREIRPIGLERIEIPANARPLDQKTVDDLYESIHRNGLLQPIGVRRDPDKPGHVTLIWGRHRLEAFRKGYELNFPREGHWVTIPAVFYTEALTVEDAEIMTLLENLQRHELTAAEKDTHRLRLAVLLKEKGLSRDKTAAERGAMKGKANGKLDASRVELPATAEAVAARTGVSPSQVNKSIGNVLDRARKADPEFDPERRLNLATATPSELSRAADLSDIQARKEAATPPQAKEKRPPAATDVKKSADHVPPHIEGLMDRAIGEGGAAIFKLTAAKVWKKRYPRGSAVFNDDDQPAAAAAPVAEPPLSQSAKARFDRALARAVAKRMAQIDEEVRQRVLAKTKDRLDRLNAMEAKAAEAEAQYRKWTDQTTPPLPEPEFFVVLGALDPAIEYQLKTPNPERIKLMNDAAALLNVRREILTHKKKGSEHKTAPLPTFDEQMEIHRQRREAKSERSKAAWAKRKAGEAPAQPSGEAA